MSGAAVKLYKLFDLQDLSAAILAGDVRVQEHPDELLAILNYTPQCAANNAWTPVTLACRGLIYRTDTLEVVARGFAKFFNHGQPGAPELALSTSVVVSDKLDGSLGIIYPLPSGGLAVATRGSFASEQAVHATELLNTRYAGLKPLPGVTTLVEIIYPANRIVCDYAGLDDLVLIGGVDVDGKPVPPASMEAFLCWPGPVAKTMDAFTFAEALALPPRPNAEGIVVQDLIDGHMVKIKQADYVALHKIVTGLNARTVWEHVSAQRPLEEILEQLPDEFHDWVRETAAAIEAAVTTEHGRLLAAFHTVIDTMPDSWLDDLREPADRAGRKGFALAIAEHPDRWAMFSLLDGRDITKELYKRAKPEAHLTPAGRTFTEETA